MPGRPCVRAAALRIGLVLAVIGAFAGPARADGGTPDPAAPVMGRWMTKDGDGVFQIAHCGATLCGWLIGMRYTGSMPLDVNGRPQCDEMLLTGFVPGDEPGRWRGAILDPDSGSTYDATIWSSEPDLLHLRGYVLMPLLGETQDWTRYRGSIGPACRLPR